MSRPRLAALAVLLLLPLIVFHRSLFLGEAFLPADLLSYVSPWKTAFPPADPSTGWNVLRYDGITQFYPWRVEAARQMRAGKVPLYNPHQFAAEPGGTPLLANSQSAPLYPLHVLFYLAPPGGLWYVFGLVSAIHLLIAGAGLHALLRACGLRRGACLFGAATWTLSGPVICWLALPSFLAVSCWLPWLLLLVRAAHTGAGTRQGRLSAVGAGGVAGLMFLAGHLQMALYGALAALLYALFLGIRGWRQRQVRVAPWLAGVALAGALALCLTAPQVLPAVELSRISHRAVTGKSLQLYSANNATALPVRNFVTLLAPDFFGHPSRGVYWNDSDRRDASGHPGNNYGEWAIYIGILPLLLAAFALATPWRGDKPFFVLLFLCAALIATGTPLNLLLFYAVPGYASLANPGRILTVVALALSALAAFGVDTLLDPEIAPETKRRATLIAIAAPLLLAAAGASFAARWAREAVTQAPFGALLAQAQPGILVAVVLLVLALAALLALPRLAGSPERQRLALGFCTLLAVCDLAAWGMGYNPTVKPEQVYPVTPGIAFLKANAANARIAVLNRDWTLGQAPPRGAALPPNALTVYGLHDVGGYDSLFPKVAKERLTAADGGRDSSPPANGNMVIVQSVSAAVALKARFIVVSPDAPPSLLPPPDNFPELRSAYSGPDLTILENPSGVDFTPTPTPVPVTFRVGLFLALCGVAALSAAASFLPVLRRAR